jgi:hypothetical protein
VARVGAAMGPDRTYGESQRDVDHRSELGPLDATEDESA